MAKENITMSKRLTFQEWKLKCPYGKWTCANGREVLFNRGYWPILERCPGKPVGVPRPGEFVHGIVKQEFFFDDYCAPYRNKHRKKNWESLAKCNAVLIEWGIPPLPSPPKEHTAKGPIEAHPYSGNIPPARVAPWKELTLTSGHF
jgi:hypothetical protein